MQNILHDLEEDYDPYYSRYGVPDSNLDTNQPARSGWDSRMRREDWGETSMVDSAKTYTFDIEGHTIVSQDDQNAEGVNMEETELN